MFRKILVANRGEIACRIIRTARRMGIATVAVYSEADRNALHVEMADEAVAIGPAPAAAELSLDRAGSSTACRGDRRRGRASGLRLSLGERRLRARARGSRHRLHRPAARRDRGDGRQDRVEADRRHGRRCAPCRDISESVADADEAARIAAEIGYPVMLKASAGGGGKGMRVALRGSGAAEGLSTGPLGGALLLRRRPRLHREIHRGAAPHRDPGARRRARQRHPSRRARMLDPAAQPEGRRGGAVALPRRSDARRDGRAGGRSRARRRLPQRRHGRVHRRPRPQLLLPRDEHAAAGRASGDRARHRPRSRRGDDPHRRRRDAAARARRMCGCNGWAIEARIYAEDPFRDFLPSIGRLTRYRPPAEGTERATTVRIDSGVVEGSEISLFYDPLIAKLCTHAPTRAAAIDAMADALDAFSIDGIRHNIPFLAALMAHPRWREGRLSTGFIAEEFPGGFPASAGRTGARLILAAIAVSAELAERRPLLPRAKRSKSPAEPQGGWRAVLGARRMSSSSPRGAPGPPDLAGALDRATPTVRVEIGLAPGRARLARHGRWRARRRAGPARGHALRVERRGSSVLARLLTTPRAAALAALMPEEAEAGRSRHAALPDAGPCRVDRGVGGAEGGGRRDARDRRGDEDGECAPRRARRDGRAASSRSRATASPSTRSSWNSRRCRFSGRGWP